MAATNVQAFSGDVEISSNLAVDTNILFVDSVGNKVGIGTTSPYTNLHVGKFITSSDNSIPEANLGADTAFPVSTHAWFGNRSSANGADYWGLAIGTIWNGPSYLQNLDKSSSTYYNLLLQPNGANVGIGTDNPEYKLDVNGDVRSKNGNIILGGTIATNNTRGLDWGSGYGIFRGSGAWSSPNFTQLQLNWGTGIILDAGNGTYGRSYVGVNDRMAIGSSYYNSNTQPPDNGLLVEGNVGIGVMAPATKLHLVGVGTGNGPRLRFETLNNGNDHYTTDQTEIGGIQFGADDATWNTQHMSSEIVGIQDAPGYDGARGVLAFKTSSAEGVSPTEKMRIRYDGHVGIGTTTMSSLLTFYKAYGLPSFNTQPGDDTINGITFRSNLNSFAGTVNGVAGIAWSSFGPVDTAKIWFQPRSYSGISSNAGNHGYLAFGTGRVGTISSTPRMVINTEGTIGIGTSVPTARLHVNGGSMRLTNSDSSQCVYGPSGTFGGSLVVGAVYGAGGFGTDHASVVTTNGNLHLDAAVGHDMYLNYYSGNNVLYSASATPVHSSDDRVKTGEKFIENALTTLKKLKPQTYLHHRKLNDETSECRYSAGLIAQEVYYQCPELKHIVKVPHTAHVDLTKDFPYDPQVDPDYSDWGDESAAVSYTELIPYTISAVKQLSNEGTRRKVQVSNAPFSNVLEYHGLVVSRNSGVFLSNVENDKQVYGVISDIKAETNDSEVLINYTGDGKVWIINAGNIEAGDYITTSNVCGYAMKQSDDTLKNYTLGKSLIDCDFTQPMIDERRITQITTVTSRWKNQANVQVLQSTYSNLSDDVRYTEYKTVYETADGENQILQEEYDGLDSESQNTYTQTTLTKYYYKNTRYLDYNPNMDQWIEESVSKTVDSLDENGQLIWENTGTQVPMYPIKYLTSDGTETDQSNAVYTAALINCSIVCG